MNRKINLNRVIEKTVVEMDAVAGCLRTIHGEVFDYKLPPYSQDEAGELAESVGESLRELTALHDRLLLASGK